MSLRGLSFERRKCLPVRFGETEFPYAMEVPLLVADELPVVCLSVAEVTELHQARILAQLRQADWRRGLLVNFNVTCLVRGVRRCVID
jgi:GxxExxY protein